MRDTMIVDDVYIYVVHYAIISEGLVDQSVTAWLSETL